MGVESLPHLNASLNATSAVLLLCGWVAIRAGRRRLHAGLMLSAFAASTLFLASYVVYHIAAGHRSYAGSGAFRTVYLAILASHIVLAVVTVPLALTTLILALRGRFDRHRRLARVTFPIWMYVSVTGVIVYVVLYQIPA